MDCRWPVTLAWCWCASSMIGDFTVRHRIAERLDVALLQMLNEHRPRVETGFARDGELRARELERARGGAQSHSRVHCPRAPKHRLATRPFSASSHT
jgi:hypothetical protein